MIATQEPNRIGDIIPDVVARYMFKKASAGGSAIPANHSLTVAARKGSADA